MVQAKLLTVCTACVDDGVDTDGEYTDPAVLVARESLSSSSAIRARIAMNSKEDWLLLIEGVERDGAYPPTDEEVSLGAPIAFTPVSRGRIGGVAFGLCTDTSGS